MAVAPAAGSWAQLFAPSLADVVRLKLSRVASAVKVPVPVRFTGEPVTVTADVPLVAVTVSVPVAVPRAVGVNRTPMLQVLPAARGAVQAVPEVGATCVKTGDEKLKL